MATISNKVKTLKIQTVNRGECEYVISEFKRGFLAHELGEFMQWPDNGLQKARIINEHKRHANQYRAYHLPVPYKSIEEAEMACVAYAGKAVRYF